MRDFYTSRFPLSPAARVADRTSHPLHADGLAARTSPPESPSPGRLVPLARGETDLAGWRVGLTGGRMPCNVTGCVLVKARRGDAAAGDRAAPYQAPDEAGARVFDVQEEHAEIDADHVGIVPVPIQIERVAKAVPAPDYIAQRPHVCQRLLGSLRCEEDAGYHAGRADGAAVRAVHGPVRAVSVRPIEGVDGPEARSVGLALRGAGAVGLVGSVRAAPRRPPVASLTVAQAAQVEVARRHLRHEDGARPAEDREILDAAGREGPGVPGACGQAVRLRRAEGEQVEEAGLAVSPPARLEEPALRVPAHCGRGLVRQRAAVRAHPAPVHAARDLAGEPFHLRARPVLAGSQAAERQQRAVDRAQLAAPDPRSR